MSSCRIILQPSFATLHWDRNLTIAQRSVPTRTYTCCSQNWTERQTMSFVSVSAVTTNHWVGLADCISLQRHTNTYSTECSNRPMGKDFSSSQAIRCVLLLIVCFLCSNNTLPKCSLGNQYRLLVLNEVNTVYNPIHRKT